MQVNKSNNIFLSQNPAQRIPSSSGANQKLKGVDLGNGSFGYCQQDGLTLSPEACSEMLSDAHSGKLQNVNIGGLDGHPQFKPMEPTLQNGAQPWQPVGRFEHFSDEFDRDTASLEKVKNSFILSDESGASLQIDPGIGQGMSVMQGHHQLELKPNQLGALSDMMATGAKNDGNFEQNRAAIEAVKKTRMLGF